jgi:hypothetical protein
VQTFIVQKLFLHLRPSLAFQKQIMSSAFSLHRGTFLGAFAKSREATIRFVMSVRLSVRMEQLGTHRTDFHEI